MSYKKSLPYFFYQSLRYSSGTSAFKQHWSYYARWWASFSNNRNSVVDQQPWISFKAVDFLQEHLEREHTLFEYGGGGSTLFFLNRLAKVITVENDEEWFRVLSQKISEMGISHWEGIFQAGEPVTTDLVRDTEEPADYVSSTVGQSNLSYEKYAKAIRRYPVAAFDWVLVDGRARPSCMLESFEHLRSGGYLILDNMERPHYQRAFSKHLREYFEPVLLGRSPSPYHPDFTDTQIWRKK
jgi:hypothetical protein